MTIEEIEKNLPNGFHDAILNKINIDYIRREADLEFEVDVSIPEKSEEAHRIGKLILFGLFFCVIESPDSQYPYQKADGLWIADSGLTNTEKLPQKLLDMLPKGAVVHYFFVNDWNAFIYLSATDAKFEWL
jgi:hypothetical protein